MKSYACILLLSPALITSALAHPPEETIHVYGKKSADKTGAGEKQRTLPQSIDIYSEETLQSAAPVTLADVIRTSPGVVPDGYSRSYDFIRIRGFDASASLYLDGMRYDGAVQINAEMYDLAQIEVTRGPSAAKYGQGLPGGMVNMISKRPEEENFLRFGGARGSFSSYTLRMDGNRAFSGNISGRLVGVMRHNGNRTHGSSGDNRVFFAPSLSWQADEATTLTLLGSYQHDRLNMAMPLPADGTVYTDSAGKISLNTNVENPGRADIISSTRWQGGYLLDHRFSATLTGHSKMRLSVMDQTWWRVMMPVLQIGNYLYRFPYYGYGYQSVIDTDNYLSADFTTGPLHHALTLGSDFFRFSHHWYSNTADEEDASSYMLLNLADPDYADESFTAPGDYSFATQHISALGAYAQDHIRYGRVLISAGLRFDKTYTESTGEKDRRSHLSPNLGISWNLTDQIMLYGDYATSFHPQSGSTYQGAMLQPETGRQWEAGMKATLISNRVWLTLASYTITRAHVARTDPSHTDYYLTTGAERSRGVELSANGQISDNWQASLSYSYDDARVRTDPSYPRGDQLLGAPQNSVHLSSRYAFSGALSGLTLSGKLSYYASQAGDLPNTFRLPAYTLVDGALSYRYGPAELRFSVNNLMNRRYFAGARNALYVLPGVPRSLRLSLDLAL